jgi:hypothetical protein
MVAAGGGRPENRTEPARIAISEYDPVAEAQIDMIVLFASWRFCENAKAAGHPEMNDQGIGADAEQEVFTPPVDSIDRLSDQLESKIGGNRPPQATVVEAYPRHFLPLYVRRYTATRRLDFGKFRHGICGAFVAA